jgi:hypothetical protein
LDRRVRRGKAERLAEGPHDLRCFISRFPFAINRSKAARIKHAAGFLVAHFKEVFPEIRVVDRFADVTRPRQRLDDNAIQAEGFMLCVSGVEIIQPHCLRRSECRDGDKQYSD